MKNRTLVAIALMTVVSFAVAGQASEPAPYTMDILVDDSPLREYPARGRVYVEAQRGEDYAIRLTNPTSSRVAVALSVDGLNTIDARHTDAWSASKWVIDPYDSIVISGWQVNDQAARRFYFTGETDSYGAAIGQTENLGVISAVFYREEVREVQPYEMGLERSSEPRAQGDAGSSRDAAAAPSASAESRAKALDDDYAATGMGSRQHHDVRRVDLELDPHPVASIEVRYEFRPQLIKLGVLPARPQPLERREQARGFEKFCPEPDQ